LVDLMEGTILVESKQDEKTLFTVTLPNREWVAETVNVDSKIALRTMETLAPMDVDTWSANSIVSGLPTLLIIDDEQDMRSFLYQALKEDYHIVLAVDGQDGLEKLEETKPQLVISDVMMPNLTGYQVCEKIKLDPDTCHIPVILLTALSDTDKKIEGLELGADDYIAKPFSIEYLEVRIRKLIESKQRIIDHFSKNSLLPEEDLSLSESDQQFLGKIIAVIEKDISNTSFGVEELAKNVGMSSSHFFRKLKQLTGQAPNLYLRNFRLQKAAELLKSDKTLHASEVMYQIGISSPSYFSTTFKKLHGVSPSEFSKNQ
jgi:DNA-binding response OmpR family regulator